MCSRDRSSCDNNARHLPAPDMCSRDRSSCDNNARHLPAPDLCSRDRSSYDNNARHLPAPDLCSRDRSSCDRNARHLPAPDLCSCDHSPSDHNARHLPASDLCSGDDSPSDRNACHLPPGYGDGHSNNVCPGDLSAILARRSVGLVTHAKTMWLGSGSPQVPARPAEGAFLRGSKGATRAKMEGPRYGWANAHTVRASTQSISTPARSSCSARDCRCT